MRRILVPALLIWAVAATVIAIRKDPTPPPDRVERTDSAELERLRRRVAELEGKENAGPARDATGRPTEDAPERTLLAPPPGSDADRLLAAYRDLPAASPAPDPADARSDLLSRLVAITNRDPATFPAWVALLREARDEDEADAVCTFAGEADSPPAGGPVDREVRAALRDLLRSEPAPFRRGAAAEMLFWSSHCGPEDFRAALDAVGTEPEEDVRLRILGEMGDASLREEVESQDAAAYLELVRTEIEKGWTWLAPTLAAWSRIPSDLDRLRSLLEASPDDSLLQAFRGGLRLTSGREAECRAILAAVVANPRLPRSLRRNAVRNLETLVPWDPATEDIVRRFREEAADDR